MASSLVMGKLIPDLAAQTLAGEACALYLLESDLARDG
jgi:hypothetical protein